MPSNLPAKRELIEEIFSLRLLGALPLDLARHSKEQGWNLTDDELKSYASEADTMLAAAAEQIQAGKNDARQRQLAHHLAARRTLFARAMAVSDYRAALSCLQDECRLLDLYPAPKSAPVPLAPTTLSITEVIIEAPRAVADDADRDQADDDQVAPGATTVR